MSLAPHPPGQNTTHFVEETSDKPALSRFQSNRALQTHANMQPGPAVCCLQAERSEWAEWVEMSPRRIDLFHKSRYAYFFVFVVDPSVSLVLLNERQRQSIYSLLTRITDAAMSAPRYELVSGA